MSKINKLFSRVCRDNPNTFRHDGEVLFCLVCDDKVNAVEKSQIIQHLKTTIHLKSKERKSKATNTQMQTLLSDLSLQAENQTAK